MCCPIRDYFAIKWTWSKINCMPIWKNDADFLQAVHFNSVIKSYHSKVNASKLLCWDFPTVAKNTTVVGLYPKEFSRPSQTQEALTSLCQDAAYELSTITIAPGVRPAEVRKKKVGKGRERKFEVISVGKMSPPGFEPTNYRSRRWYAIHSATAFQ